MIINETMIMGAVIKALQPLVTIEDNNRFMWEVSQTLNRFKTNLYLMMNEDESCYDPKEMINFSITAGCELSIATGLEEIVQRERSILRVYGIRGIGSKDLTQGTDFMVSQDVSDIVPTERLVGMHNSHFVSRREEGIFSNFDDTDRFNGLEFVNPSEHGCHFKTERLVDNRVTVEMTISARVFTKALEKKRRETADRHPGSETRYKQLSEHEKQQQREQDALITEEIKVGRGKRSYLI